MLEASHAERLARRDMNHLPARLDEGSLSSAMARHHASNENEQADLAARQSDVSGAMLPPTRTAPRVVLRTWVIVYGVGGHHGAPAKRDTNPNERRRGADEPIEVPKRTSRHADPHFEYVAGRRCAATQLPIGHVRSRGGHKVLLRRISSHLLRSLLLRTNLRGRRRIDLGSD